MEDATLANWNHKMVVANQMIRLKLKGLTKFQQKKWKDTYRAQFEDIIAVEAELQHN